MKRLHVSLAVSDLGQSVRFYSTLFAAEPTVLKPDYAKWMLEDPRVNFAISTRAGDRGLDHLGIQVDSREDLAEIAGRLERPAAASTTRATPIAAMPIPPRPGSAIPRACPGRPFSPLGRTRFMAKAW